MDNRAAKVKPRPKESDRRVLEHRDMLYAVVLRLTGHMGLLDDEGRPAVESLAGHLTAAVTMGT